MKPPGAPESTQSRPSALLGWVGGGRRSGGAFIRSASEVVEERMARRLLVPTWIAALGLVVGVAGVAAIAWGTLSPPVLGSWLGTVALVGVLGDLHLRWIARRGGDVWDVVRGTRRALLAFGTAWGGGFAMVAPAFGLERLLLLTLFLGGLGATVVMALAADQPSVVRFGLPSVAGLLVGVLRHGQSDVHWLAAASILLFVVVTAALQRRGRRSMRSEVEAVVEMERKEARLEGERGFLNALLQSIPDAIVVMERDGRILGVNQGFEETFGWKPLEVLGRNLYEVVVPEDERAEARTAVQRIAEEGASVRDVERLARDGTRVPVRILAALVEGDEEVLVVLYSDIRRLKEAEEALERAKERAEEANRAKSDFLATMSHEIRTPMNAIIGMAELLADTDLSPTQKEYVEIFATAGDTLLSLINQVLDLSKIEARRLTLDERPFHLPELVERTARVFTVKADRKGIELIVRIEPELDRRVVGDPDRLRQVLVNLLGNAVKFTEEGRVTVEVAAAGDGEADEVRFAVRDTGPGIPGDRREAIFERFTQADSSTTREHGGTGLGLTISAALVELMGGELELESEVGEGSTFHFTVPLRPARDEDEADDRLRGAGAPVGAPGARGNGSGETADDGEAAPRRILLVEDTPENRILVERYLDDTPHAVRLVESGAEAIETYTADPSSFDLVFMDIRMPGVDGYEATERIRAWEEERGVDPVPVVALTAHALEEERRRSAEAGCDDHLTKPIKKERLVSAIQEHARDPGEKDRAGSASPGDGKAPDEDGAP